MSLSLPPIKLDRGLHVMHLFYRVDRVRWAQLSAADSAQARERLEKLCAAHAAASHPRLATYANVGNKADLAFFLLAAELGQVAQMHRDLEACFAPGTLRPVFSYLSVTELSEYMPTEDDHHRALVEEEKLQPGSAAYEKRLGELLARAETVPAIPALPGNARLGSDGLLSHEQTAQRPGQLVPAGFRRPAAV